MAKVHHRKLSTVDRGATEEDLWRALESFGAPGAVRNFLMKILTRSERIMFGRRIQVAKMILQGRSFEQIKRKLRVGESTIADIYEWLEQLEERDHQKLLQC